MESVNKGQSSQLHKDVEVIKIIDEMSIQEELGLIDNIDANKTNEKSNEINIENLCRICLIMRETLLSSLSETYKDLPNMYFAVTSIKVDAESCYAFKICEVCKNYLTFFYDFKKKCQKSDFIFKTLTAEIKRSKDDVTRSVTSALQIDNVGNEMEEELIEHEDVQYLDDTLDYDDDEVVLSIVTEKTEADKNRANAKSDLRRRKISKSPQKYHCTMCPKKFGKAQTLKSHMLSEHMVRLAHCCGQCKKSFSSEHDLQLHTPIHFKTDAWTCIECQKHCTDRRQYKRHVERHMSVKRHACAACGKMFAELYALRRHERVHTGQALHKPFPCHFCDKRFRYRSLLRTHMAQHNGVRPCACSQCGKTFASERLLASHSLVHLKDKPHKCDYCDKTFRHESTRNTHHRTHTGERPHVCARCGNTFIQRSNLVRHMRVHTGEKPYTCKVCERKFGCGSSLKNHMRIHTGDKPYECKVCNKKFARSNMRLHMAKHTGERPHACAACGKRFVRPWALREHSRQHTGEKPFECAKCNEKFTTKAQLMRHFRIHEKNKKSDKKEVTVKKTDSPKRNVLPDKIVFSKKIEISKSQVSHSDNIKSGNTDSKMYIADKPLEVNKVVLQDNIELNQNTSTSQCPSRDGNKEIFKSKIHYIEMTENGPNISSAILEDGGIKLYQSDKRVKQRMGRELTVHKVTSNKN